MKKLFLFLFLFTLCSVTTFAQNKKRAVNQKSTEDKLITMPADKKTPPGARNSRTLIYHYNGYVNDGHYLNIRHDKHQIYKNYKYEVKLYTYQGNADLYVYGESGHNKRMIRHSNRQGSAQDESYYEYNDLRNHENSIVLGIYGYHYSKFKIEIYKVYTDNHNECHYNDPTYDLHWLKDMKNRYQHDKICEYEYNGKKYFKRYQCGVSHYTEYWYDCEGKLVCEYINSPNGGYNGHGCNDIKRARKIKCWYDPCGTPPPNQHCNWDLWYTHGKDGSSYNAHRDLYIKVDVAKKQDIEWCELYIRKKGNNRWDKVRREVSYPHEWGPQHNSNDRRYMGDMHPGTYELKCYYKTKCGDYKEKFSTIHVRN